MKIETLLELGYSILSIAKRLKRNASTISCELRRNQNWSAETADSQAKKNKSFCGAKIKCTVEIKEVIQEKLNEKR
ncbi:helix-turn-helix domain-containing protein [Viridibacillus sp. NPDC093762]|uniref:helix-turn-helix domain-containing protein n=1 Tax=Viridibacillus sp. NPDC093762 TaxID=3390720 RepID=UPI003D06EAAE